MKILLVGNYSSWMKLHLEHVTTGFQQTGSEVIAADYHKMERLFGFSLPEKMEEEHRQRALEKLVKKEKPDVCFFAGSCKFDLERLKSYWNGIPVFHDYDGPRRKKTEDYLLEMQLLGCNIEKTLAYLEGCPLKYNIAGKGIQKICDSFRISNEYKEKFKEVRKLYK